MPSFGETFFPDPGPEKSDLTEKPDLTNTTASEALRDRSARIYEFEKVPYAVEARGNLGTEKEYSSVGFGLIPTEKDLYGYPLPETSVSVGGDLRGRRSGTFTLGHPNLRYSTRVDTSPENRPDFSNTFEMGIGSLWPGSATGFISKKVNDYRNLETIGGSATYGPVTFSGQKEDFVTSGRKERRRSLNLSGSGSVGSGELSGGVGWESADRWLYPGGQGSGLKLPGSITRNVNLGYKVPVAKGGLGIGGWFEDIQNLGTSKGIGANLEIPLGRAKFSARGGWENPYRRPSGGRVGLQVKIPLGG